MLARLATEHDLGALLAGALDERVHALPVRLRDERAHLRLRVQRVADLQLTRLGAEGAHELVVERLLDEDARAGLAALAGGVVDRPRRARDRRFEVGVGEDDVRALAAELQGDALDRVRAEAHDLAARLRRACERDLVDARVPHEVRAGRRPVARHDVDDAGRKSHLGRELRQPERRRRRLCVRLDDDGATGGECRGELPGRHHERVVPRDDLRGDADGLLQRVGEQRAADRPRLARDRRDRRGEEAVIVGRHRDLGLHRPDRLAEVARLELGQLARGSP